MDNYNDSVGVNLNNILYIDSNSYDAGYSSDEDVNDVVSSGYQSSDDEDDDEESVGPELSNSQAVVGLALFACNLLLKDDHFTLRCMIDLCALFQVIHWVLFIVISLL
ncbi:unnamed protein product [Vicia faba]|uniref:Uncharacterized protein n=1 Tax=Vicia faba TaxID=3906 RepID=A0AAV0ZCR9_VICFA|nr:unnamed protein product [Vicia faba]